jgi:hypothetical protein
MMIQLLCLLQFTRCPKGLNADSMVMLLQQDIMKLELEKKDIVAFISDSGSLNGAAFNKFNATTKNIEGDDSGSVILGFPA